MPTLLDGDYVLVSKYAPWAGPARGTVVAAGLPLIPGTHIVKRIAAVGGDTIEIAHGRFLLDHRDDGAAPGADMAERVLPPATMYLLGDHRAQSVDSRVMGPFPVRSYRGRPVLIYWSSADSKGRWWRSIRWDRIGKRII